MFEKASRMKLRFTTTRGLLTVEDLWDLNLPSLNELAKDLNKEIKEEEEEDFLKEAKASNTALKLKFDIVIHVLNTKKAEKEAREAAAENAEKRKMFLEALARKQADAVESLTEEELKEKIAALDGLPKA